MQRKTLCEPEPEEAPGPATRLQELQGTVGQGELHHECTTGKHSD